MNNESSEIAKVEAKLSAWREEFHNTQTECERAKKLHDRLNNKITELTKQIAEGHKWLSEQRATADAARQ